MSYSIGRRIKYSLNKPGPLSSLGKGVYNIYYLLREWLVPSRRIARRLDHNFDAEYGVETKAFIPLRKLGLDREKLRLTTYYYDVIQPNEFYYQAIRPTEFSEVISYARVNYSEFYFIDIGSGMGRALLLASEFPFKKIVGVEFSPQLHEIAEENIRRYKNESQECENIELVCMDATQYPIPKEKAVFFIYNPFKGEAMAKVLDNIHKSLAENPREIFILYYNPVYVEVFDRFSFKKVKVTKRYAVFSSSLT